MQTKHAVEANQAFRFPRVGATLLVALTLQMSTGQADAQSASRLAPTITLPETPPIDFKPEDKSLPSPAPAAEDSAPFKPSAITLENPPPGEEQASRRVLQVLADRPSLTMGEVAEVAAQLQRQLDQHGFILARIIILKDEGDQPRLRIRVIDGFIERIDFDRLPKQLRRQARLQLKPLMRRNWLRSDDLARRLALLSQTPGATLSARLVKGQEFGGAVLEVAGDTRRIQTWASVDNRIGSSLGETEQTIGLAGSNLFGHADRIVVQASGNLRAQYLTAHPIYRALALEFMSAIGGDGLTGNLGYLDVHTEPSTPAGSLPVGSSYNRLSAGLQYPLLLTSTSTVDLGATFEANTDKTFVARYEDFVLSEDRTRVARLVLDITDRQPALRRDMHLLFTQSLGLNALGARSQKDATGLVPLSRQGADADFSKSEILVEASSSAFGVPNWRMSGRLNAQADYGKALLRSEQLNISTQDMLSAFDTGSLNGDKGIAGRLELSRASVFGAFYIAPYAYLAKGWVAVEAPTDLEKAIVRASSIGLGFRTQVAVTPQASVNLRGEWSAGERSDRPKNETRLSFSVGVGL